jgi:hypothetical protein
MQAAQPMQQAPPSLLKLIKLAEDDGHIQIVQTHTKKSTSNGAFSQIPPANVIIKVDPKKEIILLFKPTQGKSQKFTCSIKNISAGNIDQSFLTALQKIDFVAEDLTISYVQ